MSRSQKIFVGGLARDLTDAAFISFFTRYGEVKDAVIMRDRVTGTSRGFGFVTFATTTSVDTVIADGAGGNLTIEGRKIDVKVAVPRSEMMGTANDLGPAPTRTKKIFVGGILPSTTQDEFSAYFQSYGKVVEATIMYDAASGRSRGFGFVVFESEDVVERVVAAEHSISDKRVECKKAIPKAPGGGGGGGRGPPRNQPPGGYGGGYGRGGYGYDGGYGGGYGGYGGPPPHHQQYGGYGGGPGYPPHGPPGYGGPPRPDYGYPGYGYGQAPSHPPAPASGGYNQSYSADPYGQPQPGYGAPPQAGQAGAYPPPAAGAQQGYGQAPPPAGGAQNGAYGGYGQPHGGYGQPGAGGYGAPGAPIRPGAGGAGPAGAQPRSDRSYHPYSR